MRNARPLINADWRRRSAFFELILQQHFDVISARL